MSGCRIVCRDDISSSVGFAWTDSKSVWMSSFSKLSSKLSSEVACFWNGGDRRILSPSLYDTILRKSLNFVLLFTSVMRMYLRTSLQFAEVTELFSDKYFNLALPIVLSCCSFICCLDCFNASLLVLSIIRLNSLSCLCSSIWSFGGIQDGLVRESLESFSAEAIDKSSRAETSSGSAVVGVDCCFRFLSSSSAWV